jgi:hypothetical protein
MQNMGGYLLRCPAQIRQRAAVVINHPRRRNPPSRQRCPDSRHILLEWTPHMPGNPFAGAHIEFGNDAQWQLTVEQKKMLQYERIELGSARSEQHSHRT